jgi:alkylation response protein AidB-like acyl-CoA dehydrogenase
VPRELFAAAGASGSWASTCPRPTAAAASRTSATTSSSARRCSGSGTGGAGLGITLHNDVCLPYFTSLCTDEQKQRWLPGICSGELITAIAMTEPGIGSDLASMTTTAIRDGDRYVVNGSKTFITNGINADLVITAVKTDPTQKHKGMSLVVLERGMEGFERGRNLEKVGLHSQDTAELFFTDVRVPVENLLGTEGQGFVHLVHNLPQERLSIAAAGGRRGRGRPRLDARVREGAHRVRPAGGLVPEQPLQAGRDAHRDRHRPGVRRPLRRSAQRRQLTAEEAAEAKWWCTELQKRVVDTCVQLHGGYGYMLEYPIARAYTDARITTIYGGTTEIMKEIIGRSLGV